MTERHDPPFQEPAYTGPVKHSVTIAGHRTSISLEPVFWAALRGAAEEEGDPLHILIARIDAARIAALSDAGARRYRIHPANLASAIRIWLWERNCK